MSPYPELISRLYKAFGARDHEAMARCYSPEAHFSDPVFPDLQGSQIAGMWRMLCERATDLRIAFDSVAAKGDAGSAHWEAWYTYSATGRPVHNVIEARFDFRDELIVRHVDSFDLYAWSRQALGIRGILLGWAPPVQAAVRRQAQKALARHLALTGAGR
ncbi:MAG: nuclear transport factor 2 family protein [Candidatus Limnocylindria bacterium]